MGLTNKNAVEAVGVDTLGMPSSPRKKHKGMKSPPPLNTRKLRSHTARISDQSGINENVATRDVPTKVTGESSGCSNLEARRIGSGCNELPPPTLEFLVRSEEGINLFVDLNTNSSDWMKKLKIEVCIHPEMLNAKSRVLHRELGIFRESERQMKTSFLGRTAVKTTSDPKAVEYSPSSVARDIPEENIRSSATIPKIIAESSLVRESDPKVSSLCDDSKCPASAEIVPMSTSVSSKPDLPIGSKICEDQISLITSFPENPGGVTHMCSTGDSMGMHSSEVASYSNNTGKCSLRSQDRSDLDDPTTYLQTDKGRSGNKEPGQNTNGDPLYASSELEGGSNPISEKDSSECSQVIQLPKRSLKRSQNTEPVGLLIKRRITRSQDRESKATPSPRRSSRRLVSQGYLRNEGRYVCGSDDGNDCLIVVDMEGLGGSFSPTIVGVMVEGVSFAADVATGCDLVTLYLHGMDPLSAIQSLTPKRGGYHHPHYNEISQTPPVSSFSCSPG